MQEALISVQNLKTYFRTPEGLARAVNGISFEIAPNEIFALVHNGCHFHPRCPEVMPVCKDEYPDEIRFTQTHSCNCYLYQNAK